MLGNDRYRGVDTPLTYCSSADGTQQRSARHSARGSQQTIVVPFLDGPLADLSQPENCGGTSSTSGGFVNRIP